ncbi:Crp/Fnr family transcriptional regulator [Eubacteriaceae bacterium ES3]|nr:Crp/Fnr family transcriptional regulator [Eubacteriaceae bacterium ES3]
MNINTKKYNCMKELEIFDILTANEKLAIHDLARGNLLKKGEFLFNQGDEGHKVFLIQTGKIMLQKYTEEGTKIVIDILKPGDLICENIIFEEINYPFSGVALENSYICACSKNEMNTLIKDPLILEKIFMSINNKMLAYTERMTTHAIKDVQSKIYTTLKLIADRHGRKTKDGLEIDCYLSHEDIGFLVNASRVTVTRSINELIEMGKLGKKNRHYIISL